ncbi:MAG TPA: hypothetical protein VFQ89_10355, partial [Candidatus Binatia bacterium]|nr:hypothetical protein [Candidatus Binatia bacterium]
FVRPTTPYAALDCHTSRPADFVLRPVQFSAANRSRNLARQVYNSPAKLLKLLCGVRENQMARTLPYETPNNLGS